jgi:hypothetical protein
VEVIDPTHALFGRKFPLISFPKHPGAQFVLVRYRECITLRIPLQATTLVSAQPKAPTKLTLSALLELISVAEAQEVLCPPTPLISGSNSLPNSKSKSWPNSRPFSRK